jgi:hypothetical protein
VGQAGPVKIVLAAEKDLGLVLKPAKCRGVDDAVSIDLERSPVVRPFSAAVALPALFIESIVEFVVHSFVPDPSPA